MSFDKPLVTESTFNHYFVKVNGIKLKVIDEGEGEPVLLLHGFPDSHHLWRYQIPALVDEGYRVIAPDLRGFGESEAPLGVNNYHPKELMKDVIALLDEIGIDKAHLIAHDFGAILGWNLVINHPDRFVQYTALSVGHIQAYLHNGGLTQTLKSWYTILFRIPGLAEKVFPMNNYKLFEIMSKNHSELDHWRTDLNRPGRLTAAFNWYRATFKWARSQNFDLQRVGIPVMGIWSKKDIALSQQQMLHTARYVDAGFQYHQIDDAGHWMQIDTPEKLNKLLISRLNEFRGELPGTAQKEDKEEVMLTP